MEQFVREPVDSLCKEMIANPSKRIILNGGRGIGKSVILHHMQYRGLGTKNQTILIRLDAKSSLSNGPNEFFDEEFFNHYYECIVSCELLSHIKENYPLTYEAYFKDMEIGLQKIMQNTIDYINNMYYEKKELQRYLLPTKIVAEIIEKLKSLFKMNTLTLAIDRFDWISGCSAYVQQIISNYFKAIA